MRCSKARDLLLRKWELNERERERLDAHISACPECASEDTLLSRLRAMLRQVRVPALPGGLLNNFWGEIRSAIGPAIYRRKEMLPEEVAASPVWGNLRRSWLPTALAAGLLVVVVTLGLKDPAIAPVVDPLPAQPASINPKGHKGWESVTFPEFNARINTDAIDDGTGLPLPMKSVAETAGATRFASPAGLLTDPVAPQETGDSVPKRY